MTQYSHRNGEIDVPTISDIYWTYNEFGDYYDLSELAIMPTGQYQMRSLLLGTGWQVLVPERCKQMGVQWYGPVMPPWDARLSETKP
jgi:hypothetical protein